MHKTLFLYLYCYLYVNVLLLNLQSDSSRAVNLPLRKLPFLTRRWMVVMSVQVMQADKDNQATQPPPGRRTDNQSESQSIMCRVKPFFGWRSWKCLYCGCLKQRWVDCFSFIYSMSLLPWVFCEKQVYVSLCRKLVSSLMSNLKASSGWGCALNFILCTLEILVFCQSTLWNTKNKKWHCIANKTLFLCVSDEWTCALCFWIMNTGIEMFRRKQKNITLK